MWRSQNVGRYHPLILGRRSGRRRKPKIDADELTNELDIIERELVQATAIDLHHQCHAEAGLNMFDISIL